MRSSAWLLVLRQERNEQGLLGASAHHALPPWLLPHLLCHPVRQPAADVDGGCEEISHHVLHAHCIWGEISHVISKHVKGLWGDVPTRSVTMSSMLTAVGRRAVWLVSDF